PRGRLRPGTAHRAGGRRRDAARRHQPRMAAAPQPRVAARPARQPYQRDRALHPQWTDAMSAWTDYLGAAQRLDIVRRDATTAVATQTAAVQAAQQELATVRQRLALQ